MPITAANIQTQDYKFALTVANSGTWRWTTRLDVSGLRPSAQVVDVVTPWGLLRDTIPIPGEVVKGMNDSIEQVESNFPPHILVGPPTSLTFVVDEGRGFSASQNGAVTNDGVYGSLLDVTLTPSAGYVSVTPLEVGNLASNEVGAFQVAVDSTSLLAASSPYSASLSITDSSATNTPQALPITITVRPKATISLNEDELDFTVVRPISGPFPSIPTQLFTITNSGPSGSVLTFQVQRVQNLSNDWLATFTPVTGGLNSGASQNVTITIVPIEGLALGTYTETLRVSGYSTNSYVDILIQLVIT